MRLFLASQDFGKHASALLELVGINQRTLFIINARDDREESYRQSKIIEKKTFLENNGFVWAGELDLRNYFDKNKELRDYLRNQKIGHIHVTGGNVFLLRQAFTLSGFDYILKEELFNDNLVYSGSSAGSMIMSPDLKYYSQGSRAEVKAVGYPAGVVWEGLSMIDEYISPHHFTKGHEEVSRLREEMFEKNEAPHVLLGDEEVLVIDGYRKVVLR